MGRLAGAAILGVATVLGCSPGKHQRRKPVPSALAPYSSSTASAPKASASASRPLPAPSASAVVVVHSYDAGTNACRRTYGPLQQPFLGEVALVPADDGVLLVTQEDGVPTVTRLSPADADAPAPSTVDAGLPRVSSPPCAIAGSFSFCMDPGGSIHKRPLLTEGRDVVVARTRPGTSFAAEAFDGGHVVVAYLADRQTTEGSVSQAFAILDEGPPLRLSDEGSGTTSVSLARRGTTIVALLLDGRVAMTPVHARVLRAENGKLEASEDAVVFVGGGAEAYTRGTLGLARGGEAFALVPIAGETGFGLATVRIDDPPHTDEPTTWSLYLNGLDPAPVVATEGTSPIRVARVRPLEARPDAPRGLELGKLDEAGSFVSYGLVGSKGRVKSAAIAVDKAGMVWLAFTDGAGTWVERRACP